MNDETKAAYRHLLYVAMIATRNCCQPRARISLNPFVWRRRYHDARLAGHLADWLHNLALYSSRDFVGFEEEHFWREHASMCQYYPSSGFQRYREIFDAYFKGERCVC